MIQRGTYLILRADDSELVVDKPPSMRAIYDTIGSRNYHLRVLDKKRGSHLEMMFQQYPTVYTPLNRRAMEILRLYGSGGDLVFGTAVVCDDRDFL